MLTIKIFRNSDGSIDWITVVCPRGNTLADCASVETAERFCRNRGWIFKTVEMS